MAFFMNLKFYCTNNSLLNIRKCLVNYYLYTKAVVYICVDNSFVSNFFIGRKENDLPLY